MTADTPMPKSPPKNPNLADEIAAAQNLLQAFHAGDKAAIDRVHQHLPQVKYDTRDQARDFPLTLNEAQTVIAREYGLKSWGELRLNIKLHHANYGDALQSFIHLIRTEETEQLAALLEAHPELRDTINDPHFEFGSTALITAKNNLPMVDLLLEHGADINAKSQWWAGDFHILEVTSAETAQQLIERGAQITVHAAAEQGWLAWLDNAYQQDPSIVHLRGGDGKTALHCASDPKVMDWLLERGADIEARDLDHASTALQWKLGEHNYDAARELIKRGAQVDIFAAAILSELELLKQALAEHPQAIRARVNGAGYPLTPQADGSHQYVYTFNSANLSVHQVALLYGHDAIFAYLLAQSPPTVQLLAYCASANAEDARQIAAEHPQLVARLPEADQRQLIQAAWSGDLESVKLMAALGFNLHIRDDDAMTPLHAAAFHGFVDVISALLAADDQPPLTWLNAYGGTPLTTCLYGMQHSWRSDGDFPASLKLLVEAGSPVPANFTTGDDSIDAILRVGQDQAE